MLNGELHITTAVAPGDVDSSLSLRSEVHLLRVALLYGDRVKLCSPATGLVLSLSSLLNLVGNAREDALQEVLGLIGDNADIAAAIAVYRQIKAKKRKTSKELVALRRAEIGLKQGWDETRKNITGLLANSGANDISKALASGLIEVDLYDQDDTDGQMAAFFESISSAVTSPSTYPLFDDSVGGLVQAAIKAGKLLVPGSALTQGKVIGLARDLFERLPTFDAASLDEILGMRKELESPLIRFRSAITGYSRVIASAQWDRDFAAEADLLFREKVAPAVEELEEISRTKTFRDFLLKHLISQDISGPAVTSILGIGLTSVAGFSEVASIATGLSVGALRTGYAAYDQWKSQLASVEGNSLYFYCRVRKQLPDVQRASN